MLINLKERGGNSENIDCISEISDKVNLDELTLFDDNKQNIHSSLKISVVDLPFVVHFLIKLKL